MPENINVIASQPAPTQAPAQSAPSGANPAPAAKDDGPSPAAQPLDPDRSFAETYDEVEADVPVPVQEGSSQEGEFNAAATLLVIGQADGIKAIDLRDDGSLPKLTAGSNSAAAVSAAIDFKTAPEKGSAHTGQVVLEQTTPTQISVVGKGGDGAGAATEEVARQLSAPATALTKSTLVAGANGEGVDGVSSPSLAATKDQTRPANLVALEPQRDQDVELPKTERLTAKAPVLASPTVPVTQVAPGQPSLAGNQVADGPLSVEEIPVALAQNTGGVQNPSPISPVAAPPQLAQHAASQMVAALPRDQGVFVTDAGTEIALDPPELGRVRMIVTEIAGGLALTVTAERPETLDLFRKNAQLLAQEFAREGFGQTNFAFSGDGASADQNDGEQRMTAEVTQDIAESSEVPPAQSSSGAGLDIRL